MEKPSLSLCKPRELFLPSLNFFCEEEDFSNGQISGRVYRSGTGSLPRENKQTHGLLSFYLNISFFFFLFMYAYTYINFLFGKGLGGQLFYILCRIIVFQRSIALNKLIPWLRLVN